MVLSSTHTRLTRTSSDLRVLSAILLPPSPVLEAADLLISSTSGEIPIFLEATTHACYPELSESCGDAAEPKSADKLDASGDSRSPGYSDESLLKNRVCEELGNRYIAPALPNARHAKSQSCFRSISTLKNTKCPADDNALGSDAGRSNTLSECSTPIFSGKQGNFDDSQASCPITMELCTTTGEDLDGDQVLMTATFHTYSTLPTPTFVPPSPSPSADVFDSPSSPVGRQRHRRPLERARAVRFPGRPKSPRLQGSELEADLVHNGPPSLPKHISCPRWKLTDSPPTASIYSCTADTYTSGAVHPFMKHVTLPKGLSWLQYMTIELWIDQEGFRAVRSCMQLMGYSPRTRSLHPYESGENARLDVTAGIAEFMPTKREAFAFHYATLDGPPTLRMVSVVGDETRDYISRQATLSVKTNGVYTVLGTETFMGLTLGSDAHKPRPQNARLRWKFDYFVSDRNVDGAGKTLPGEKTLTPLTFSCSTHLFHPFQGKKAGLMHTMKKNLVPKVGSQKVKPPPFVSSRGIPLQASWHLLTSRDTTTHARSHSDASTKSGRFSPGSSPLDTGVREGTIQGMNHIPHVRRRRASSAGENGLGNEPRLGGIVALKDLGLLTPTLSL